MNRLIVGDASREGKQPGAAVNPPATSQPTMPIACSEFCARSLIECEVKQTLDLARKHFSFSGQPSFEVVDDPECGMNYLAIHVDVSGDPQSVFQRSEGFLDEFVTLIDRRKQRLISLVYHPI